MWRLTGKSKQSDLRFLTALLAAVIVHSFLFSQLVLVVRGTPGQYRIDVIFWGSILRRQDLQPQLFLSEKHAARQTAFDSAAFADGSRARVWRPGFQVEKPAAEPGGGKALVPQKFPTRRVELDDVPPETVSGIPDAPRVPLR